MTEKIEGTPNSGDIKCICGNEPFRDGFDTCDPKTGEYVEPNLCGPWDQKSIKCVRCGRIIDQSTLLVVANPHEDEGTESDDGDTYREQEAGLK